MLYFQFKNHTRNAARNVPSDSTAGLHWKSTSSCISVKLHYERGSLIIIAILTYRVAKLLPSFPHSFPPPAFTHCISSSHFHSVSLAAFSHALTYSEFFSSFSTDAVAASQMISCSDSLHSTFFLYNLSFFNRWKRYSFPGRTSKSLYLPFSALTESRFSSPLRFYLLEQTLESVLRICSDPEPSFDICTVTAATKLWEPHVTVVAIVYFLRFPSRTLAAPRTIILHAYQRHAHDHSEECRRGYRPAGPGFLFSRTASLYFEEEGQKKSSAHNYRWWGISL